MHDTGIGKTFENVGYWQKMEDCFVAEGGEEFFELAFVLSENPEDTTYIRSSRPEAIPFEREPDFIFDAFTDLTGNNRNPSISRSNLSVFLDDLVLEEFKLEPHPDYELDICINTDEPASINFELIEGDPFLHYYHAQFLWSDGDTLLYRSFEEPGLYSLQVQHTCFNLTYQFTVLPIECEEEDDEDDDDEEPIEEEPQPTKIYIPNAFTPNGDGINDFFKPEGMDFDLLSLQVYDRYGNVLYQGQGESAAWDGTAKGRQIQPGVYIYLIHYQDSTGNPQYASGEVNVKR